LCSRWCHREGDLVVHPRTRRGAGRPADPLALQPRRGHRRGQGVCRDGRRALIALDMKTGKPAWDTKLINSQKLTVGFTGAPLYAKGVVVIGAQGGEWPYRGPIFGVDAATGQKKWEFLTVGGTDDALKTWGNE